jgi:thermitase
MIHAADSGYQVVNMSYAGPQGSQAEADAAAYAWANGVVLVAAASNNYESTPMYPAAFPEVIAVASTDWHDNLSSFSNFGSWVSVAAPGSVIFNTMPNWACGLPDGDPEGCYGWNSGTSMASPVVAGAAGLLWAHLPGATNTMVRDAIETNADATGAMGQNFLAWTQHGRLNVANALANGGGAPPPPPPSDPGVHIGDLDGAAANQGRNWHADVTVTVHDENENPVANMTVEGTWSGGTPDSCMTNGSGQCPMQSPAMAKKGSTSTTFTVTTLDGDATDGTANHDNDGSSNGTSITVTR